MERLTSRSLIALGLLLLSTVAVILGILQISQGPAEIKGVTAEEGGEGTILRGTGDRLAYISISGMIIEDGDDGSLFAEEPPSVRARKLLYYAASDKSVKGVLLRINSPGGTVGMSQEIYDAVLTVRKEKPVVVSMGDVAASGGYYIASAADKIVANPGTLTASIGVILHSMNLKGLMTDKLGIYPITIKSGRYKDILSPYRPATEDEMKMLQSLIDTSYQQFLHAVLKGRTRDMEDSQEKKARIASITAVADGRVVVGEDAFRIGLVDKLGGLEDARKLLQELAADRFHLRNPKKLNLQEYETPFELWKFLGFSNHMAFRPTSLFPGSAPQEILPASWHYPNRPLWLME